MSDRWGAAPAAYRRAPAAHHYADDGVDPRAFDAFRLSDRRPAAAAPPPAGIDLEARVGLPAAAPLRPPLTAVLWPPQDEKEMYIRRQQREMDALRDELRLARERERNPELLRELAAKQDAIGQLQDKLDEARRDVAAARDQHASRASLEVSTLQAKLALAEQEVRGRAQDLRARDARLADMQAQLTQELEQSRRAHEVRPWRRRGSLRKLACGTVRPWRGPDDDGSWLRELACMHASARAW